MFTSMRKNKREITEEGINDILKRGEYGTLSVTGENGYPYVVPLSYVYNDNSIYFHCAKEGHKIRSIKDNNKVSFCIVVDTEVEPAKFTTKYKSIIAFGEASEVNGEEKEKVLLGFIHKYSPEFIEKGEKYVSSAKDHTMIIKIDIKHITGKANL